MLVKEICLYDKKRDRIELDCITEFYFFWGFEDCSVFVVESQILLVPAVSLVCLCVCVCGGGGGGGGGGGQLEAYILLL